MILMISVHVNITCLKLDVHIYLCLLFWMMIDHFDYCIDCITVIKTLGLSPDGFNFLKLTLPVTKDVWLYTCVLADFTDSEINLIGQPYVNCFF